MATLKHFFKHKNIALDEDDERPQDSSVMKVVDIEDRKTSLTVTYEYTIEFARETYRREVQIDIKFGESRQDRLVLCIEHCSGNRLYYKMVVKEIKKLFSYCLK